MRPDNRQLNAQFSQSTSDSRWGDVVETPFKSKKAAIFHGCLAVNHIPSMWMDVSVIFIPKAGKPSHITPKDFRPKSLSSFLLKTLERLIDPGGPD